MKLKTEKKYKIIEYLLNGLTYSEIAIKLNLKISTIKKAEEKYIKNYFNKK